MLIIKKKKETITGGWKMRIYAISSDYDNLNKERADIHLAK